MAAAAAAELATAPPPPAPAKPPSWLNQSGPARVQRELRSLAQSIASGVLPGIRGPTLVDDDVMVWRLEVNKFDPDMRAGQRLNEDLYSLGQRWGKKHAAVELELKWAWQQGLQGRDASVLAVCWVVGISAVGVGKLPPALSTSGQLPPSLHAGSPPDYPSSPFFLRVVRPRMAAYSGHVTAGGSVCLEALTLSGGAGSWRSDMCVEAVLVMVLQNMLHAEEVYVQTQMSGGQAGPLRINMSLGKACLQEYPLEGRLGAKEAFQRTLAQHGWQQAARPAGGGAAAAAAAGAAASHLALTTAAVAGSARLSWVPGPAAGAQPARQRTAVPSQQACPPKSRLAGAPPKKRPAVEDDEVIVLSDSEDEVARATSRPAAKQARNSGPRPAGASGAAGPTVRSMTAGQPGGLASGGVVDLTGLDNFGLGSSGGGQGSRRSTAAGHVQAAAVQPPAVPAPLQLQQQPPLVEGLGPKDSPLPAHWQLSEEVLRGELVLVDLPLPAAMLPQDQRFEQGIAQLMANGCSREQAMDLLDAHGGDAEACLAWLLEQQQAAEVQADPAAVAELLANGLTVADAEAALHHCNNDVDLALAWAADCLEAGGPAAVAGICGATAGGRGRTVLAAGESVAARRRRERRAEREAQHRRLQQESAGVLERFARGSMRKEQVHRIQRIQNKELWEDYLRRWGKIERTLSKSAGGAPAGALLNERQLFHGADKDTLGIIMKEGFDHRVSNVNGALGTGVYFADASTYSDAYSRAPKHSADMAGGYGYGSVPGVQIPSLANAQATLFTTGRAGATPSDGVAMLLCDVTLGISGVGRPGMRRAAPGSHSSSSGASGSAIHAVYHNDQAYPAYLIHYR